MPVLMCNACNREFDDEAEQKFHCKSGWHRYNVKRKVAGVPGVTEALFMARELTIAQQKNKLSETSKAHTQNLQSRSHIIRSSQGTDGQDEEEEEEEEEESIVKPLPRRAVNKPAAPQRETKDEADKFEDDDDFEEEFDPSSCFMCDRKHGTIENCMVHMHKQHGLYIPDVEYLQDPKGLLTCLGQKVKRDFRCLYCNDRCSPFSSLEAVRKHMEAKSHCKVHYGDGGDDEEEAELDEFYDYTSSYMDEEGKQLVAASDTGDTVELGCGSELIISKRTDKGMISKIFGSREYLRYYRQKPRPTPANNMAITAALAALRYRSMVLATVQSREQMETMKVMKEMNRRGVEAMRTKMKMGMKSNVIRNLPKNVPY